jgi:hypothetical protein
MTIRWPNLRDLSLGDVLILLAVLTLGAALTYPALRARAFRVQLQDAVADVETMSAAARQRFASDASWPTPSAPGVIPREVAGAFPRDTALTRDGYTLQWRRWEVVEEVEGPPLLVGPDDADAPPDSVGPRLISVARPIGGVVVHSGSTQLLAELLRRYGTAESFVRDTLWTLVVDTLAGS